MDLIRELVNHLTLPPSIPSKQYNDLDTLSDNITDRLIDACQPFLAAEDPAVSTAFTSLLKTLADSRIQNVGRLDKDLLLNRLAGLESGEMVVLYIVKQNAAMIIQRVSTDDESDDIILEAFEASPRSKDVLASINALQWQFPGRAVAVEASMFLDDSFLPKFASFMEQASMETIAQVQASIKKAGTSVAEIRDTPEPTLISEMLMPLLEALGRCVESPVIHKRIRDDVNIYNAELPWRRLPFWLVLRVSAIRSLTTSLGMEHGRICYKYLIVQILATLLKDSQVLSPDIVSHVRAKLCSRLAKLDRERTQSSDATGEIFCILNNLITPHIGDIVLDTNEKLHNAWERLKSSLRRRIPKIRQFAYPSEFRLQLPNSGHLLDQIISQRLGPQQTYISRDLPPIQFHNQPLIQQYSELSNLMHSSSSVIVDPPGTNSVQNLAEKIMTLMDRVGMNYAGDPIQTSNYLLVIFEIWMEMDKAAIVECSLLAEYQPVFSPDLLDVLQLPKKCQMNQLQIVQKYIMQRISNASNMTMTFLGPITDGCFADRFVRESFTHKHLLDQVEAASQASREGKRLEWQETRAEYESYSQLINADICRCTTNRDGSRNVKGCKKCYLWRQRRNLGIDVHEDYLPEDSAHRHAIILELDMPSYIADYRNATWRIIRDLAHPDHRSYTGKAALIMNNHKPYRKFTYGLGVYRTISMASVGKSFLDTHYKFSKANVGLKDVLLPLAPDFLYYDSFSKLWLNDLNKRLTLQHLVGISIPRGIRETILPVKIHPLPQDELLSSYETQAILPSCPKSMSVHEYRAFCKLLHGQKQRWINILVELGSSNLNFSDQNTTTTITQLAVQAGPNTTGSANRDVHQIFNEDGFVEQLINQISVRLNNIRHNWREANAIELLVRLIIRAFELTEAPHKDRFRDLSLEARQILINWIKGLRHDFHNAQNSFEAIRLAHQGCLAALICRSTYEIHDEASLLTDTDVNDYLIASLALQEFQIRSEDKLSEFANGLMIRDINLTMQVGHMIETYLKKDTSPLSNIVKTYLNVNDTSVSFMPDWSFLQSPDDGWVVGEVTTEYQNGSCNNVVHINFVSGFLLVNGQPMGMLPPNVQDDPTVKRLFNHQHLMTFVSSLPGMTHKLAHSGPDQDIHFGLRSGRVIIRTVSRFDICELIPQDLFRSKDVDSADLPFGLIDNCVHFLSLTTQELYIRREHNMWANKPQDWVIDLQTREAIRGGKSSLIDPFSEIAVDIQRCFAGFEDRSRLTIFQPKHGVVRVELRHLELSFKVLRHGLLFCEELGAEVTPNQDAGTFYGLQSHIVLFDRKRNQKSIILPSGEPVVQRRGAHVTISITRQFNTYIKFDVDDYLGRLTNTPEPRLIYFKALLHALTSSIHPDPLTGRTGTEEAYGILSAAIARPWTVFTEGSLMSLKMLKELAPVRNYYPKDMVTLQTVSWNSNMTVTIQQDHFEALVQNILDHSENLAAFIQNDETRLKSSQISHLRFRGCQQQSRYKRKMLAGTMMVHDNADTVYDSRDRSADSNTATRIFQLVHALKTEPVQILPCSILSLLESYTVISGPTGRREKDLLISSQSLSALIGTPLAEMWGPLLDSCRSSGDRVKMMFELGLVAFGRVPIQPLLVLAAIGLDDDLHSIAPPNHPTYTNLDSRGRPSIADLEKIILEAPIPDGRPQFLAKRLLQQQRQLEASKLAELIRSVWPASLVAFDNADFVSTVIDVDSAVEHIEIDWHRRLQNDEFADYMVSLDPKLEQITVPEIEVSPVPASAIYSKSPIKLPILYSLADLVGNPTNLGLHEHDPPVSASRSATDVVQNPLKLYKVPNISSDLGMILSKFGKDKDSLRKGFAADLSKSLSAYCFHVQQPRKDSSSAQTSLYKDAYLLDSVIEDLRKRVVSAINQDLSQWTSLSNLGPCTSLSSLFSTLSTRSKLELDQGLKECLVSLAVAITIKQRKHRLDTAYRRHDESSIRSEENNIGHENFDPIEYTDWLLMELDCNLLIRAEQVEVAHAIICPSSNANSVLQLNMGKGKTSVIVPLVLAVLANQKNLARLIVPKALLLSTAQILQSRIGGLVDRRISHVPFTRRTPATPNMLDQYRNIHQELLVSSGVVLTTPENILLFKLSGWQLLIDGNDIAANKVGEIKKWLDSVARDVIDESDLALSTKTMLIYPSGAETAVDGAPLRWKVAQELLSLVADHAQRLQKQDSSVINIVHRSAFPIIHFVNSDMEALTTKALIQDVVAGRFPLLRLKKSLDKSCRQDLINIISTTTIDDSFDKRFKRVVRACEDRQTSADVLLILRGLLSGILILCLKKRWNVQYGLHPLRDPIAVPFEARGVPSERAEFGHADVAIVLTNLAFYYSGLNLAQFKLDLDHVLKSDDPTNEWDRWTSTSHLPDDVAHWNTINVDDQGQIEKLYKALGTNRHVINHYLNNFVFPVYAKQFSNKLQSSSYDLVLYNPDDQTKARTTGFSGTNDNKYLLPLNIKQDDLPGLMHTNAEVLTYLLEPRNMKYRVALSGDGSRWTEEMLIRDLESSKIRVLIDAGAYILELKNIELVRTWLKTDTQAKAAVFFGENDHRAWVLYRNKTTVVPLLATPFANDLEGVLVFMDEAHTRGVDLKFPPNTRAALTLAHGQTKDHTLQAAMRLRQLSTSQSITFIASPEAHHGIVEVNKVNKYAKIDSSHVIMWLLEQTCRSNESLGNLHRSQGLSYIQRQDAELANQDYLIDVKQRKALIEVLQQPEKARLSQLYGSDCQSLKIDSINVSNTTLKEMSKILLSRQSEYKQSSDIDSLAAEQVEQEREVEFQVEEVRQIQKPPKYKPLRFNGLHADLKSFVESGKLPSDSTSYLPAFDLFKTTDIGKKFEVSCNLTKLYVSTEFVKTVELRGAVSPDNFMRPVEWILWSIYTETAVIIIPEEAELILSRMNDIALDHPKVHLIAFSAPITKAMKKYFNSFRYYCTPILPLKYNFPKWFVRDISLFAGTLYLDLDECLAVKEYLGSDLLKNDDAVDAVIVTPCQFTQKPTDFILELTALRRKTQDVLHTPMGYICQGRSLDSDHPFFLDNKTINDDNVVGGKLVLTDRTVMDKGKDEEEEMDDGDGEDIIDDSEEELHGSDNDDDFRDDDMDVLNDEDEEEDSSDES